MKNISNRSFTLIELVFVIVVVSVGLMSILYVVGNGLDNVYSMRQRVVAINLAREGIEGMYQIRDTNRLMAPANKDYCRLDMNPLVSNLGGNCKSDTWMGSGNYILQRGIATGQKYFYLSGGSSWPDLDVSNGIDANDFRYALCLSGGLWESCPNHNGPVVYFRQIRGYGVFYKDVDSIGGTYLNCNNGNDTVNPLNLNCGGIEAKEYRFCSRVVYIGKTKGEVELCGLMTNFLK